MDSNFLNSAEKEGAAASFIDVLCCKGLISWHSAFPVKNEQGYEIDYPPFVQWRCIDSGVNERALIELIQAYPSKLDWELRKTANGKWRMTLQQVWHEFDSNEKLTPIQASGAIRKKMPELGQIANKDMLDAAAYLSEKLNGLSNSDGSNNSG